MLRIRYYIGASFVVPIFLWLSGVGFCQPIINSLSGTLNDGQTFTVEGLNFGPNGPNVFLFDSFEGSETWNPAAVSSNVATIGQWSAQDSGFTASTIGYSSLNRISGAKSFQILNTSIDGGPRVNLPPTNLEIFYSFWAYVPLDKSWPGATSEANWSPANWKIVWLKYNNNSGTGSSDLVLPRYLGVAGPPTYLTAAATGNTSPVNIGFGTAIKRGEWFRFSAWVSGRTDGTGQIHAWELTPSTSIKQVVNLNNANTIAPDGPDGPYYFNTFVLNGFARVGPNDAVYFDDVYIATGPNARARIEIGNASTYYNCTNISTTTVTNWTATQLTTTFRQGSFKTGDIAYLYIFDSNGLSNPTGFPIKIGSKYPLPPPPDPAPGRNIVR